MPPTRQRRAEPLDWPLADLEIGQTFIVPITEQDGTLKTGCGRSVPHIRVLVSKASKALGRRFSCNLNRAGNNLEVSRSA